MLNALKLFNKNYDRLFNLSVPIRSFIENF